MGFKEEITRALDISKTYRASMEELEEELSLIKEKIDSIETDEIPSIFHEYGFTHATLDDGTTVKLKSYVSPKVQDEIEFYSWLELHGLGAIIKDQIDLGKGQFDESMKEFLEKGGYDYSRKTSIHPQTLKATVNKLMELGEELPSDNILTITVFEKAEIKTKKE